MTLYVSNMFNIAKCAHGRTPKKEEGRTRVDCPECEVDFRKFYPDFVADDPHDAKLLTAAEQHEQEAVERQFQADRDAFMKAQYHAFLDWQASHGAEAAKDRK